MDFVKMNFITYKRLTLLIIYVFFIILFTAIIYLKRNKLNLEMGNREKIIDKIVPMDEFHTLKQLFFIGMAVLLIIDLIICELIHTNIIELVIFDIILSFIAIYSILRTDYKNIIPAVFLVPSISILILFGIYINVLPFNKILSNIPILYQLFYYFNIIVILRLIGTIYAIIFYIKQFLKYTRNNNLSFTIVILLLIVSVSLVLTMIFEGKDILDSAVMVTNAFTSNGYTVLGSTAMGKLDSILLTWGGYLLSGVGTATLAAAIITKMHKDELQAKTNKIYEEIEENKKEIASLNENIKELKEMLKKED